jgi:hypothetical protein
MKRITLFVTVLCLTSIISGAFAQLPEAVKADFPHRKGNLYMSKNFLNFNYLKDSEERTDSFAVFNAWSQPMEVMGEKPPKYMEIVVKPPVIPPQSIGMVYVTYSGIKRGEYGFVRYNAALRTNDADLMLKTFPVNAYIEEDFSKLSDDEKANPPALVIPQENFNFGTAREGDKVVHKFLLKNEGKRDLIIRSTQASCGCTASHPEKTTLAPGEETFVGIEFDTRGRKGRQHKTVTVFTNDPRRSSAVLHFEGKII